MNREMAIKNWLKKQSVLIMDDNYDPFEELPMSIWMLESLGFTSDEIGTTVGYYSLVITPFGRYPLPLIPKNIREKCIQFVFALHNPLSVEYLANTGRLTRYEGNGVQKCICKTCSSLTEEHHKLISKIGLWKECHLKV